MAQTRLVNGDPLLGIAPNPAEQLFREMVACAGRHQYLADHVATAGAKVLLQGVRQACDTRAKAERKLDEMWGQYKQVLLERHYDAVTGKRRPNFAFDQRLVQTETFVPPEDSFLRRK